MKINNNNKRAKHNRGKGALVKYNNKYLAQ